MLVEKMGSQRENAIEPVWSATEQFRNADLRSNKTEEERNLTERTDDVATSTKLRPPIVNKVPQRAIDPMAGNVVPQAPAPAERPMEGPARSRDPEVDRRTLIVGQGIALTGEVTSCDRLVVEGSIQATLQKCQNVIIAETGVFNGHASTENADVRGRFDGDLVVRKRLLIRAGGHVSGTVTYGEIEIESGGGISGTIQQAGANHPDLIALSA
jgi:cytoskeletal protein CcmA (bactofilin family)